MNNFRAIAETLLGIIILFSGFYTAYYYVVNIDVVSPIVLAASLVILGIGIVILIRVGKSGSTIFVDFNRVKIDEDKPLSKGENFVEKNAKISAEWARTVEKKDKLKSLKIAAAAEEGQELQ